MPPNDVAINRLATAVIVEQHDEWQVSERRYVSKTSMARLDRRRPNCRLLEDTGMTGELIPPYDHAQSEITSTAGRGLLAPWMTIPDLHET